VAKKINIKFPILQSLILNYLFFNQWLIQNSNLMISDYDSWLFSNTPFWVIMLALNLIVSTFILFKKLQNESISSVLCTYVCNFSVFPMFTVLNQAISGLQFQTQKLMLNWVKHFYPVEN